MSQSAADPTQKHEYEVVRPFGLSNVSGSLQWSSLCTIADSVLVRARLRPLLLIYTKVKPLKGHPHVTLLEDVLTD